MMAARILEAATVIMTIAATIVVGLGTGTLAAMWIIWALLH